MEFNNNMEILKKSFPEVWQKVIDLKEKQDSDRVRLVVNKGGNKTLQIDKNYIHNRTNAVQEARNFIAQFNNVNDHSDILFYGLGLGYHINAFVEKYPNTPLSIYEPAPEVFFQFLYHSNLQQIPLHLIKNIYIENTREDMINYCTSIVNKIRSSILIIDLPTYKSIFPEKHQAFFSLFESHLRERRNSLATVSAFQKRWTKNSMKNLIHILSTPNILLTNKGSFQNKPAILVASGPSLEEEIDNLRIIREKGLAYVFSVGTAINALIKHDIYPHAACTYDPTEENQIVCKEVLQRDVKSIPLIFGSTVGYETVDKYPGSKLHMLISQDTVAAFYLKTANNENHEFIHDATTIAIISLQLLYRLGFNPIILVGQNLAYRDRKYYVPGATYHPHQASEKDINDAVMVKDVYGNEVASNHTFNRMRQQLEIYLGLYKDLNVINTTKYGAHIEGTYFQNLDELIKNQLHDRIIENHWIESGKISYDMNYLMEKTRIMNDAYVKVMQLLEKCKLNLDNIRKTADIGDPIVISHSYEQFNHSMDELRKNQFMLTFIEPMNRVELEFLMLAVPDISSETNPISKAQMMEKEFRQYLHNCEQDIVSISPLFHEMNDSIKHFYAIYNVRKKAVHTKILLVDCDGILTDGALYYSASGDEFRKFHYKDRTGINHLREIGIETLLINPQNNPVIQNAARNLEVDDFYSEHKREIIATVLKQYSLDYTELACIFNDISDLDLVKQMGLSFAVKDACRDIQNEVDYVLTVNGGQGALMEIAELLTFNISDGCSPGFPGNTPE